MNAIYKKNYTTGEGSKWWETVLANGGNSVGGILGGIASIVDAKTPETYNTYVEDSSGKNNLLLIGGIGVVVVIVAVLLFRK